MLRWLFVFGIFSTEQVIAQTKASKYPKGYFRNPLGIPMNLSGNFGELRPNHYHMGIDLKTNARENLPVVAAADGYVSRIKIEPGGFGRAIYIDHPNGYTTLYAHLNTFNSKIEAYLKEQQYKLESWNVLLMVPAGLLPVTKGQFIANSGNTGGSQGPHLHFEIRDTETDVNLNPLLFGFPVADKVRPQILRLALYDRTKSIYEQSPKIVSVKSTGAGKYSASVPLITVASPRVSFAVTGYDTHTGSSNLNGIFSGDLSVDGNEIIGFEMDNISYNDTRYLNAHIDYRLKSGGGAYLQHLSQLPGYINSIYTPLAGEGDIDISDGETHNVSITIKDADGNSSVLSFKIKWSGALVSRSPSASRMFYPLMLDGFESDSCEFFLGERSLYDSVHIGYRMNPSLPNAVSGTHTIGASYIPLQENLLVRIRPNQNIDMADKDRVLMQWQSGARKSVQKVEWQKDWAAGYFRDFGSFRLIVDTIAPVIRPIGFANGSNLSKATRIVFTVSDNAGRIKSVRTELDGKWIRFTNDKGRNFIYGFDEKCGRGNHTLKIIATDEAGNVSEKSYDFIR